MLNENNNSVPLECPSTQQEKKIDPIVDVVKNELNPPKNAEVQQIISKTRQE